MKEPEYLSDVQRIARNPLPHEHGRFIYPQPPSLRDHEVMLVTFRCDRCSEISQIHMTPAAAAVEEPANVCAFCAHDIIMGEMFFTEDFIEDIRPNRWVRR